MKIHTSKVLRLYLILSILGLCCKIFAQTPSPFWERYYNAKTDDLDAAHDLKIDESGNLYLTGESNGNATGRDVVTIKYNSLGQILWLARFDNPYATNMNLDVGNFLDIDIEGNVYVTGMTTWRYYGMGFYDYDFLTIKYDTSGNMQWFARYDSSGGGGSNGIVVDSIGNAYITGTSPNGSILIKYNSFGDRLWTVVITTGTVKKLVSDSENNLVLALEGKTKYIIAKFNQNGQILWEREFAGTTLTLCILSDLTLDKSDNIYVTGRLDTHSVTVKYNSNGQLLWSNFNPNLIFLNSLASLVSDSLGYVYGVGKYSKQCYTVKYGLTGNVIWERNYSYANREDIGVSIGLDKNLNVYVAERSLSQTTCFDLNTIKYANNGNQLWATRYSTFGCETPVKLVVDSQNKIFVTGLFIGEGTGNDYGIIKLDSNGSIIWPVTYTGPPTDEYSNSILTDDSSNVYLIGSGFGNESNLDYMTIQYNAYGNTKWTKRYNGSSNDSDIVTSSANGFDGRVYLTGNSKTNITGFDYVTVRYDRAGNQELELRYNNSNTNGNDYSKSVTTDLNNNIYVTGTSFDNSTGFDYLTIKYNSSGVQQWVARYNGDGNGFDAPNAIIVDSLFNVYVTGKSLGSGTDFDYLTIKYNAAGSQQWIARYNGDGNGFDEANSMASVIEGNIYVTGKSLGIETNYDYTTIKYNQSGIQEWIVRYNGGGNGFDEAKVIQVDTQGSCYISGNSYNSDTKLDLITIKYDNFGNISWTQSYNGQFNDSESVSSMKLSATGSIFVTGKSKKNLNGFEMIILRYNSNGVLVNSKKVSSYFSNEGILLNTDKFENVYVAGNAYSLLSSMNHTTQSDFYASKLTSTLTPVIEYTVNNPENFTISQNYPNPFNPVTKISFYLPHQSRAKLTVYDLLGREVMSMVNSEMSMGSYTFEFDGSNFASGIYFYRLDADNFTQTKRMVLIK